MPTTVSLAAAWILVPWLTVPVQQLRQQQPEQEADDEGCTLLHHWQFHFHSETT